MNKTFLAIIITALVLGVVGCRPDQQMAPDLEEEKAIHADYVGSEACAGCHSTIYNKFTQSGHPYKLTKVVHEKKPAYFPFTSLPDIPNSSGLSDGDNTLGPPASYADVSYVIGGFKWKARFVDTMGYIITGSDTQYNYETDEWVAYDAGVVDKPYNCGKCHTTGWIEYDDSGMRQDNLPGMDGVFFKGGIHCEECHGEGAAHVNTNGNPAYITVNESSELCGRCHTRDSQNRIAASGGYIKHHEQYDELLGLNPDNVAAGGMGRHLASGIGCNTCHDPHATTVHQDTSGTMGIKIKCETCHADKVIAAGPHTQASLDTKGLYVTKGRKISNCLLCHMPKVAKSAVGHDAVGTGPVIGDIKSHIFKIDLSKMEQFTSDGSFAYPWLTGKYACKQCHNGVYFFNKSFPSTYKIHN